MSGKMNNWMRQIAWAVPVIFLFLMMLAFPSTLLANDSVTVDVGEMEAGKEVTVRFRATVSNDLPASESSVNRDVTVSGQDEGGTLHCGCDRQYQRPGLTGDHPDQYR